MDDGTLRSLEAALAATPENASLAFVVVQAYLDRADAPKATVVLDRLGGGASLTVEQRCLAARAWLASGNAEKSLAAASGSEAEVLIARARALSALGRREEALGAYNEAVEKNAALEDLDLRAAIGARQREVEKPERPKLRVIANDDTDAAAVARVLHPEVERVTFADVGGLEEIKKQITRRIILPFQKPSIFERFKKRVGGGILLYGPPGCGKTLLARATAGECKATFLNVAISDILDMYIGESERKLHAIFEKARSATPAILFFDELEALAGKRHYSREQSAAKLVSQFLSEMDGFSKNNSGVLVLGATNVPWSLDPAFRRPGRFDRSLFVPPPDRVARKAILDAMLEKRPTATGIDASDIAAATSGFSGADMANLVETASDEAIDASLAEGREVPISHAHLKGALRDVKATTVEWLSTARNYARYANEAGQYDEVLEFLARNGKA
jgi:SpoVK/Ycf46/Vps4 family AAA+-type ATPase